MTLILSPEALNPGDLACQNLTSCAQCVVSLCVFLFLQNGKTSCIGKRQGENLKTQEVAGVEFVHILEDCKKEGNKLKLNSTSKMKTTEAPYVEFDASMAPTALTGGRTDVGIAMEVANIMLDGFNSIFSVEAALYMVWEDYRLAIPKGARDDLIFHFSKEQIWWPDLIVKNSKKDGSGRPVHPDEDLHLLSNKYGNVTWDWSSHPAKLDSACDLSMWRWPFDTQKCNTTISLGQRSRKNNVTDLKLLSKSNIWGNAISLNETALENSNWAVVEFSAARAEYHDKCCPEPFGDLVFSFTIKRHLPILFILITVFIILVNIVVLWRPIAANAGRKHYHSFTKWARYPSRSALFGLCVFYFVGLFILLCVIWTYTAPFSISAALYIWNLVPALICICLAIAAVYFIDKEPSPCLMNWFKRSPKLRECLGLRDLPVPESPTDIRLGATGERPGPSSMDVPPYQRLAPKTFPPRSYGTPATAESEASTSQGHPAQRTPSPSSESSLLPANPANPANPAPLEPSTSPDTSIERKRALKEMEWDFFSLVFQRAFIPIYLIGCLIIILPYFI